MNQAPLGSLIRCSVVFTNDAGVPSDPGEVNFQLHNPNGSPTNYVYGTNAELVKDSVGHYHVDVNGSISGKWAFRFYSTGDGQAANESSFRIGASEFA